jgi:nucleoside-diphosphate-sugar epimerase
MRRRVPDTSKIERMLGWQATSSLDEILSDVIEHELAANTLATQGASSTSP